VNISASSHASDLVEQLSVRTACGSGRLILEALLLSRTNHPLPQVVPTSTLRASSRAHRRLSIGSLQQKVAKV
jgi:hypothetical protein